MMVDTLPEYEFNSEQADQAVKLLLARPDIWSATSQSPLSNGDYTIAIETITGWVVTIRYGYELRGILASPQLGPPGWFPRHVKGGA